MIHRLHLHIRSSPDVTGTRKGYGIREEGNERDIVSHMLLEGGGRHAAHHHTVSQSFFFPVTVPNSIHSHYSDLPSAVVFC